MAGQAKPTKASTAPKKPRKPRRAAGAKKAPEATGKARSSYDAATSDAIIKLLEEGETLSDICRAEAMPKRTTFLDWVKADHDGLTDRYARARVAGFDARAENLRDLARESRGMEAAGVQAVRLEVDTEKWLLSKLAPDLYGDRLKIEGEIHHYHHMPHAELLAKVEDQMRDLGILVEHEKA